MIFIPRGPAPSGQHQELRVLYRKSSSIHEIPTDIIKQIFCAYPDNQLFVMTQPRAV